MQLNAALAGRYVVEREIGRGGMATVYLARDLRHDRLVALKVLDPELGALLGVERFLSEIRVTATLQHPNLLPLFDSGQADDLLFYVMPFVEGESLRARLDRERQLPIDDAVRITSAIANALDYAHRHGVIHRDLKPENILLHDGQPVVADFGIALAVSNAGGDRVTQTGLSLGTPRYMSPEQATGDRIIDGRSDIYSLGAVAYEMLVGDPPHTGSSAQAVIAKVVTERVTPIRTRRGTVPEHIAFAVERALEKLPADRWTSARAFVDALDGRVPVSRRASGAPVRWPVWLSLAAAVVLAAFGARALLRREAPSVASTVRFTISSVGSGGAAIERAAISPDGQNIVMAATLHDTSRLWIRRLDELDAHPVAGSEGATDPFFSPDGKWIGYVATDATVRKIPIEGGASIPLARFANAQGIAWVTPDTIIAGMALMSDRPGLTRISASGAQPTVLTKPVTEMHHYPVASADGRSVLFAIFADSGIKVGHLALGTARIDTIDVAGFRGTVPVALWGNRLIFRTFNGVWAADLDASHRRVTSPVVKLIDRQDDLNSEESLARTGTVVNTRRRLRQSIIAVKPGGVADTIAEADADDYYTAPRWSPDRSVAAIFSLTLGRTVLVDRRSHISTRVGNGFGFMEPAWSSDGTRVVSNDTTTADSVAWWFWRDGRHPPERIAQAPSGWLIFGAIPSADERTVLLEVSRKSQRALYVTPLHGRASDARLLVQDAVNARWSPDARWIVYDARVNGRMEIFAQAIPSGGRIQLTESGGSHPVWPRGTNTLYYEVGQDIMAMDLDASASGLRVLRRRQVWHGRSAGERGDAAFTDYDVTPSGDLLLTSTRTAGRAEVVVEVNALAGAKGSRR